MFHNLCKKQRMTASPNTAQLPSLPQRSLKKTFDQLITKVLPSDKCFHKDNGAKLTFASKHAGHFGPCIFQARQCTMQMLIPTATHTTPSNAALHESKLKIIPLHLLQAASVYLLSGEKKPLSLKYLIVIPNHSTES